MVKTLPLQGIRVVDMTIVWAGTFATMMLADMGAEVIRVESTRFHPYATRGAVLRPSPILLKTGGLIMAGYPNREAGERPWNRSAVFNCHARNKLSVTMDSTKPEGIEIIKKLITISDIFIENNAYGVVERMGLGYKILKEIKPDLIMVSLPGFGNNGPYKDRVALGRHLEDLASHTLLRGYPDSDPTLTTDVYHCDATAGAMAAFAVVAALNYRQRTGKGQFVDIAQIETTIPQLGEAVMDYTMNQRKQEPIGNRHPWTAPCGAYPCKGDDRWVAITVCSDDEWKLFCSAMGNPSWTSDEKFSTGLKRWQNQDELDKFISGWTRQHDDFEVMELLQKEGVAAGPVMDERDCYNNPHLKERGFFEQVTHSECGTHLYPGMLWKLSGTQLKIRTPACRLGEHNEYVYKKLLKFSDEEYAELEKQGHIGMDYDPSITIRGKAKD